MWFRVSHMNQNPTKSPIEPPVQSQDPRLGLAAAIDLGGTVIAQVSTDQLSSPTPCADFDVAQLAAHLLGVLERIRMVGQRETELPDLVPSYYQHATFVSDWDRLANEIHDVWQDHELLGAVLTLPFAQMPGAAALGLYTSEVLVHTWDLASAIGVDVEWDQELAAGTLIGMQMGLPAEGREAPEIPFDAVVPTTADATAMDRLVAWMGRTPGATAA